MFAVAFWSKIGVRENQERQARNYSFCKSHMSGIAEQYDDGLGEIAFLDRFSMVGRDDNRNSLADTDFTNNVGRLFDESDVAPNPFPCAPLKKK